MTISSWAQLVSLIGLAYWLEALRSYQEFQSYVDILRNKESSERRLLSCSFFAVVLMISLVLLLGPVGLSTADIAGKSHQS